MLQLHSYVIVCNRYKSSIQYDGLWFDIKVQGYNMYLMQWHYVWVEFPDGGGGIAFKMETVQGGHT